MSEGNEGRLLDDEGKLSMKERTSVSEDCPVTLPPVELESENSKDEGTVDGVSSCSSRFDVTKEFQTSASN